MEKSMEKIVALAKARGFVYPGSEIYGGLANTWDYGNLGVELKNNVKRAWWQKFVQENPYNVGVDCAILMNPQTWVGWLTVIISTIILGYYSIIGGWVIKYLVTFITNSGSFAAVDGYFNNFISQPYQPILYGVIFSLAGLGVLLGGVRGGIEKAGKVLMPILIIISIIIAVYSVTLPGAIEGVKYILIPNFSHFGFETVVGAVGQMFYSMSLAMGIMITFGSYLSKDTDIERSVKNSELRYT